MGNFNKTILLGNLTRDVELRTTQGGTAIGKFGMAINRKFGDKEETCFVDCTAWGKQAEILNQYVGRGDQLFVEGRLTYSQWESEQGKRSKLEVTVENFQFVGGKSEGAGRSSRSAPDDHKRESTRRDLNGPDIDEVPF